jgi:hypothetical protein
MHSGYAATTAVDVSHGNVVGYVALKNIPNVSYRPTQHLPNEIHMH